MGASVSQAKAEMNQNDKDLQALMSILENKRDMFLAEVKLTRGDGISTEKEVQGGRTVSRVSDVRVQTKAGAAPGIGEAISDFLKCAQGGDVAKESAVKGAENLVKVGLDALFGAGEGVGNEKSGFVVLFMNYAFVRVDFFVYTYSISGDRWGAHANRSGSCYVADIAVLDSGKDVKASEIDYLLAQALGGISKEEDATGKSRAEFNTILKLKINLVQSAILSKMLAKDNLSLADIKAYTDDLVLTQKAVQTAFSELADYVPDSPYLAAADVPEAPDDVKVPDPVPVN